MFNKKILFLVFLIIGILILIKKRNKNKVISPTNISNGLTFEIPFENKDKFYIEGLKDKEKLYLKDFLENKVNIVDIENTEDIDNISVWFDDDLRADYSTKYIDNQDIVENYSIVKIDIKGNINHKIVKAKYI